MNYENFGNQPSWLIFYFLEKFEKFLRLDANVNSKTDAIGWAGLMNAFKGKDSPPIEPELLLPFPSDSKTEKNQFSSKTRRIIVNLIKRKALPREVNSYLCKFPEIEQGVVGK